MYFHSSEQESLIKSERLYRLALAATAVGVWEWDLENDRIEWDKQCCDMLGYPPQDRTLSYDCWRDMVHSDDSDRIELSIYNQLANGRSFVAECRLLTYHKTWAWVKIRGKAVAYTADGAVARIVGTHADIGERKQAEESLLEKTQDLAQANEKLQRLATVFTHAREGVVITTPNGTIMDVNQTYCRISGYSREELIGNNPRLLQSGRHDQKFYADMWRTLTEEGHWSGEIWNRRKDGELYVELITISAVRDDAGNLQHYVALLSDVTAQKDHQRQLEYVAHFDTLTGLPNRKQLVDRLHQLVAVNKRRTKPLAVAYLDLDGFKSINDSHGHDAGDYLLTTIGRRMKNSLREGDFIARFGGDEFVVVFTDLEDIRNCAACCQRLLTAISRPVVFDTARLQVSASVGIAFHSPSDSDSAETLLRHAGQAMYQAKILGKNRYQVFDNVQARAQRHHHENIVRIRQALDWQEFILHYQPKVNMRSGEVVGVEALIRWQHPDRGLLSPGLFLPDIEKHEIGIKLGEWVIETALKQVASWQKMGLHLPVSVNIAANHLQADDFVDNLRRLMAEHPAQTSQLLSLEVLETSALDDIDMMSKVMANCGKMGVGFALDDFGTGYSSLTYLRRLPAQVLKIDQSFVRNMLDDPEDLAILEGVMGLASVFRRQPIAEGVETVAQGELLLDMGCDLAQGYGIARPMPADDIPTWTAQWYPYVSWYNRPAKNHDDLQILFAAVEHRAWINAMEAHLQNDDVEPPMDQDTCRFGLWLNHEGKVRYAKRTEFQLVEQIHAAAHQCGYRLIEMKRQGNHKQALAGLADLYQLRDRLLNALMTLSNRLDQHSTAFVR